MADDGDRVRRVRLPATPLWKRTLDLTLGTVALFLLSPVMAAAAILILASDKGPVLFRQTRIGLGGRQFTIYKFRTMHEGGHSDTADREAYAIELSGSATPEPGSLLYRPAKDPRVTPVGRLLRRSSIDELPQLFNVIKGDMSLVGPRPALPWEAALFTDAHRRRHDTLPGITGLWQVSGRNSRNSLEMLELDVEYVEHRSPSLDLSILLRTPRAVIVDRNTR